MELRAGLGVLRRVLSQGPDTGDQVQIKEEAGKIWGEGTNDRDLGQKAT